MSGLVFNAKVSVAETSPLGKSESHVGLRWQERQRCRIAVILDDGRPAAILLPRGETLRDGDRLTSDCGEQLRVRADPEALLRITASQHLDLIRLVYHLANRHVRAMLSSDAIYIEPDPVLAGMVRHLGGQVDLVQSAFEPERGAYHGSSDQHPHSHGHSHAELDATDLELGRVGEELSRQAHARR